MIFELKINGETEYLTAKNQLHAIKSYCKDFGNEYIEEMESIKEISVEEAEKIMIHSELNGGMVSLLSLCTDDEFEVISTSAY